MVKVVRYHLLLPLACVAILTGCLGPVEPVPPAHWHDEALELEPVPQPGGPRLQVIITYDATYSTHTALRLANTVDGALFWDPAGRYGEASDGTYASHIGRVNDLIIENEPTLEMYWESSVNASDNAMEVFEWDLSKGQAQRFRLWLLQGAGIEAGEKDFRTKTIKPFCSVAVSQFLRSNDGDPVSLENSHFLPHDLAAALYRSDPDRVVLFRRDRTPMVYTNRNGRRNGRGESGEWETRRQGEGENGGVGDGDNGRTGE